MNDMTFVLRAVQFAHEAHHGKVRDDGRTPYIVHPLRVAERVSSALVRFPLSYVDIPWPATVVAAAVLHDVVEDCSPEWGQRIPTVFNSGVAELVHQLTNPSGDLPDAESRAVKKLVDRRHYADPHKVSLAARIIKLADRIDNLRDFGHWKPARAVRYLDESESLLAAILAGLHGSDVYRMYSLAVDHGFEPLVAEYQAVVAAGRERFKVVAEGVTE